MTGMIEHVTRYKYEYYTQGPILIQSHTFTYAHTVYLTRQLGFSFMRPVNAHPDIFMIGPYRDLPNGEGEAPPLIRLAKGFAALSARSALL